MMKDVVVSLVLGVSTVYRSQCRKEARNETAPRARGERAVGHPRGRSRRDRRYHPFQRPALAAALEALEALTGAAQAAICVVDSAAAARDDQYRRPVPAGDGDAVDGCRDSAHLDRRPA